jgi:flagellar hook-basal body complex protein FliE
MPINKIIDPSLAANAYSNNMNIGAGMAGKNDGGVKFSDMLKEKVSDSIDTMRAGELMSAKAITGDAQLTEVVQAVTASEVTLQTMVSVRDRMISAYQEIMRMPI